MYDESAKVPLLVRGPGFDRGRVDTRAASLMDLSATILALGQARLPEHTGHDLRAADRPARAVSSYYGGLMNIALPPQRHRMLRRGKWKLIWFDGEPPVLFDLHADPDELTNLAPDPAFRGVLDGMTADLMAGWDPPEIAAAQARKAARTAVIRDWVKAVRPPEPHRWVDPDKGRNRYE
jgi:choline-sulfatase